ncbi:hypothetical protein BH09MYX1_BH09MYX1_60630 [soil metagenome]
MTLLRTMPLLFVSSMLAVASVACSDGGGSAPLPTSDAGTGTDAQSTTDTGTTPLDSGTVVTGDPTAIDVSFAGSCPGATPCGGAVVGTWDYTSVCVNEPFDAFKKSCPTAKVTNEKGTVKGRVIFDGTNVKRTSTVSFSATIDVPAECSSGQCAAVEAALKGAGTASCKASGGGCLCDLALTDKANETNAYTVQGTQVQIADGATYDFCVSGSKLSYVPAGSTKEHPGAYEMTKK